MRSTVAARISFRRSSPFAYRVAGPALMARKLPDEPAAGAVISRGEPGHDRGELLRHGLLDRVVAVAPPPASLAQALDDLVDGADEHQRRREHVLDRPAEHL